MSVENSRLHQLVQSLILSGGNDEWRETLSGRIFANLEAIAKRSDQRATIRDPGGPHEHFSLGKDTVNLTKRLADATVGEDGGRIETYAESWEYRHFPWWKEALHVDGALGVKLLGTPIAKLAADAGVLDPESLFNPENVVAKHRLNPQGGQDQEITVRQWVKDQIKEIFNPLLLPDYRIEDYEQHLRLKPLTKAGEASLLEGNNTYDRAKEQIAKGIPELEKRYQTFK